MSKVQMINGPVFKVRGAVVLAIGFGSLAACGAAVNPDGVLEASSAEDVAAAMRSAGSETLTLGEGMLKWTGTGETTVSGGFVGNAQSNLAVTVNVTDKDATLKIAGKASNASATVFVKSGPGTVEFTGAGVAGAMNRLGSGSTPWQSGYWRTYAAVTEKMWSPLVTTWPSLGWAYGGTTGLTLVEGTVRLNAPGETFALGNMPWIGNRTQLSQTLEITNRTTVTTDGGWFSMSRGTGLYGNSATSTVRLADNSSLEVASLCMGNGNDAGNSYYARSVIEVAGGSRLRSSGAIYQPEHNGSAKIVARDGSTVIGDEGNVGGGWQMAYAASLLLENSSTGFARGLWLSGSAAVTVSNKSVLALHGMLPGKRKDSSSYQTQKVHFDDATLTTYKSGVCDWFDNMGSGFSAFTVGAGGLAFENDSPAYFGTVPQRTDGPLVKRGAGTLYVPPFTNGLESIRVEGGRIGFVSQNTRWTNLTAGVIASVASAEVGGEGTLGGRTLRPDGDLDLAILPHARVTPKAAGTNWRGVNWGLRHFDGTIQLTQSEVDSAGAIWRKDRIDVTTDFTATFNAYAYNKNNGQLHAGWFFMLQTMDTERCGGSGDNHGYNNGSSSQGFHVAGCNSFGLGVSYSVAAFMVGKGQGTGDVGSTTINTAQLAPLTAKQMEGSAAAPVRCTVKYDATAHRISLTVVSPSGRATRTFAQDVDLATHLGATTAYVGFTGGTAWVSGSERGELFISDFQLESGDAMAATEAPLRLGGNVALGADRALKATLAGTRETSLYALDSLQGAGAVTLELADAGLNAETPRRAPSSARADDWIYVGNGHYTDAGPACAKLTTNASGGIRTKSRYPVKGSSWKIAFIWHNGAGDAARSAADYLFINLGNKEVGDGLDATGLALRFQMYNKGAKSCFISVFKDDAQQTIDEAGATTLDATKAIDFWSGRPVAFEIAYDDAAKTLVTTLAQDGRTATATVSGFDANAVFLDDEERLCFYQRVGGCQVKSVIADFAWTGACIDRAVRGGRNSALAFDRIAGVTALTKMGDADLAFLKPDGLALPVTLAAGGLRFAKEPLQPLCAGVNGGWIFNTASGAYSAPNGVYIGSAVENNADNAQTRRRVRVSGKWRARWRMTTNGTGAADAMGFFIHNDPRGNQFTGGSHAYAGIYDAKKIVGVTWYTYSGDNENKMGVSTWSGSSFADKISPVNIRSTTPIETTVDYDQSTKQMTVTLAQGANTYTKTYTPDVVGTVGDDYAYLAFGTGGGGAHTYAHFDNFVFENLDGLDPLAATRYVGSIDATGEDVSLALDTPVAGGAFNLAETVKVAAGSTLTLRALDRSAVATMATLELGAGAKVAGLGDVTLAPGALAGASARDVSVEGLTFNAPAALEGGVVRLSGGAKLFATGRLYLKAVYVDGVKQSSGSHTAATDAWLAGGTVEAGLGLRVIIR